ncbi:hypothetical protein [Candidatus Hodarchaeum mangrovi]
MSFDQSNNIVEALAWQIMIVSLFHALVRQTLNLLFTMVGISNPKDSDQYLKYIFNLVRKGIIYVPEVRLEVFQTIAESIDAYLVKDYDETIRHFIKQLNDIKIELEGITKLKEIPINALTDLKNLAEGKYVESFH